MKKGMTVVMAAMFLVLVCGAAFAAGAEEVHKKFEGVKSVSLSTVSGDCVVKTHKSGEVLVDIEAGLAQFRDHPVCLIWGMKDWCFTPKFLAKWQDFLPDASVLRLANAGHYLFEDEPDEIAASVLSFLKE